MYTTFMTAKCFQEWKFYFILFHLCIIDNLVYMLTTFSLLADSYDRVYRSDRAKANWISASFALASIYPDRYP